MWLTWSQPHDDVTLEVSGARIKFWPMDLSRHRRVLAEATVHAQVTVCLGRVLRVVDEVGVLCLALVCQGICLERGALLAGVEPRLQEEAQQ